MPDDPKSSDRKRNTHSAQDVRQAEINLRKPWQRWVFFGGLGAVVLVIAIATLASRTG
ncbi:MULTISPECIES: hypothetical protein [Alphaproteobacteria]|uniref:hypothetical protein n=1 Tax=Alphaproteobacteria TaxID=28211 RepID=UPI001B2051C0|nr:hypothetical protein [Maricaulis sp.]MBO6765042.1 hypothetical protein [Maricaulis sp.]